MSFCRVFKSKQGTGLASDKKKSARLLAVELLAANDDEGTYINHLIEKSWAYKELSNIDRALCLEIIYGVLRNKRHLDTIVKKYVKRGYDAFPSELKNILRSAIYQLAFLEKIPDYAVLSEAVDIAKKLVSLRYASLVNGVLRNYQRNPYSLAKPVSGNINKLAEYYSHPDWLVKRFAKQFGKDEIEAFLAANNQPQPVYFLQLKPIKSQKSLRDFLRPVPGFSTYFKLQSHVGITHIPGWKEGVFCVQDPGSGMAVNLLAPQVGEKIIDLCAAPGGKTMAISALVGKTGRVIAVESVQKRAQRLRENTSSPGFENVEIVIEDARKVQLKDADAVLIDAPCSGLGVLARRADLRWQRTPYDFIALVKLQQEIISKAVTMIKPGGRIVYSTCTLDKAENEEIAAYFLKKFPDFEVEQADKFIEKEYVTESGFVRTWPFKHGIDGSFSVRLTRKK